MAVGSSTGRSLLGMTFVLIGETCSGKTALSSVYKGDTFNENEHATTGIDHFTKDVVWNDECIHVVIYATLGKNRFSELCSTYCRQADAVLVCYDITSEDSFDRVPYWVSISGIPDDAVVVLVGCKSDLEDKRQVPVAKAKELADSLGNVRFFETSAKTGCNVDQVFNSVISDILNVKPYVANQDYPDDRTHFRRDMKTCLLM